MAAPKIKSVRLLKNHGAVVTTESTRTGLVRRFIRPDGSLTTFEAAAMLGTYSNMIVRMATSGRITADRDERGRLMVPLRECRRIKRLAPGRRLGVSDVKPKGDR